MTENHGYDTPSEGSEDWHIPLNDNFEKIDTDVEIRDAEDARDSYTPKQGAKFLATDTGAVYIADGSQWNYLGDIVPEQTGGSGTSPYTNVAEYSGTTLSEKLSNALSDAVGTTAKLVVPDTGSAWDWGSGLTIDPTDFAGLTLEFQCSMNFTGSGHMLTVDTGGDLGSQLNGSTIDIEGGRWLGNGGDGAIRLIDTFFATVAPRYVDGFSNGSDGAGVRVENRSNWSESNEIRGQFNETDYAIHFDTRNLGGGTTSFQDTVIRHVHSENHRDTAFRFGDSGSPADLANMYMDSPRAFNHHTGVRAFYFNGRFDGAVIAAPECESFTSDSVKFEVGPDTHGPTPLLLGGNNDDPGTVGPDTEIVREHWGNLVPRICTAPSSKSDDEVLNLQDVGHSEISYTKSGDWDHS